MNPLALPRAAFLLASGVTHGTLIDAADPWGDEYPGEGDLANAAAELVWDRDPDCLFDVDLKQATNRDFELWADVVRLIRNPGWFRGLTATVGMTLVSAAERVARKEAA